jgi:hypothetical protein
MTEADLETSRIIGRLRSAAPSREPALGRDWQVSVRPREVARMLAVGVGAGTLFVLGSAVPNLALWHGAHPVEVAARHLDADPYAEARISREILDRQSAAPVVDSMTDGRGVREQLRRRDEHEGLVPRH